MTDTDANLLGVARVVADQVAELFMKRTVDPGV
jgi:hypothetical protein